MRFLPARLLLGASSSKSRFAGRWAWAGLRRGSACLRLCRRLCSRRPSPAPTATAVLIQPNLDVGSANNWQGPRVGPPHRGVHAPGRRSSARPTSPAFRKPARPQAKSSARRIPRIPISWSGRSRPRPSIETDPSFKQAMREHRAAPTQAPLVVGGIGWTRFLGSGRCWHYYNSALIVDADGQSRRPLRQNSPRPFRRVHSLPESAHLRPQAHRPRVVVHARQRAQGLPARHAERRQPSLRRLHLLRSCLRRRGAPVCAPRRRSALSTSATTDGTATPALPGST